MTEYEYFYDTDETGNYVRMCREKNPKPPEPGPFHFTHEYYFSDWSWGVRCRACYASKGTAAGIAPCTKRYVETQVAKPKPRQPITPAEVEANVDKSFPNEVINVFDNLIKENYRNGRAEFYLKDAINRIATALGITRDQVIKKGYCDVEELYRKAGWKVKYDQPAYCESYDAYFVFEKGK